MAEEKKTKTAASKKPATKKTKVNSPSGTNESQSTRARLWN